MTTNTKHPVLRRSAITFLGLMLNSALQNYSISNTLNFPVKLLQRLANVLGYVGDVDEDALVRFQAKEVIELLPTARLS